MTVKSQLDTGLFWELFGDKAVLESVVVFAVPFSYLSFLEWKSLVIRSY